MNRTYADYLIPISGKLPVKNSLPILEESLYIKLLTEDKIYQQNESKKWKELHYSMIMWSLSGFSVLIHGYGSKRRFMNEFIQKMLKPQFLTLVIRGYCKHVKFKSSLVELINYLENSEEAINMSEWSLDMLTSKIRKLYKLQTLNFSSQKRAFIIINNIDCISLRPYLSTIAQLAQIPILSILVTVDNIRWPFLWSTSLLHKMNFIYIQVHTKDNYSVELKHQWGGTNPQWLNLLIEDANSKSKLDRFDTILKCLTPSHVQLTKLIATLQLNNPHGITEDQIFKDAKSSMLVTTKDALSHLLVELYTHDILVKEHNNSKKVVKLSLSTDLIQNFLA
ncbi:origin recognition complex subunit 2 family protein [Cryptosporidium serpentis]